MKFLPEQLGRTLSRQLLITQKQSPHILFVSGIAGVVGSAVLACKATLKLGDILEDTRANVEAIRNTPDFMPERYKKELAYSYGHGTWQICRLYAPAVLIGAASLAALTSSHIVLSRRNAALTAAYAAVAKAYDEYRDRVRAEVGPEKELDIYHSVKKEEVEGEDGKKKELNVADPNTWSPYARFFDEGSRNWKKNAELNFLYLEIQQRYFNQLLTARGHVFLNEVYDQLDIERTKAGQVVGWVRDGGDRFIDFGMYEASSRDFLNGTEPRILLDFNVDGVIYDKI